MQFVYGMLTMAGIYIVSGMVREWIESKTFFLEKQVKRLTEENKSLQDQVLRMRFGGPRADNPQSTGHASAQLTQQYQTQHNRIARYFPK